MTNNIFFLSILYKCSRLSIWLLFYFGIEGKRSKAPPCLIRPLPWILFLPTLIVLRYTRVILSLISICFGYDEIEASTMVTFLHQSRRTIRHIADEGKRKQNQFNPIAQNSAQSTMEYTKLFILSILSNLTNLLIHPADANKVYNNKTSVNYIILFYYSY